MSEPSDPRPTKRGWLALGAGCGCLLLVLMIGVGIYLSAGWSGFQEAPKIVDVREQVVDLEGHYPLRSDQQEELFRLGYPEAFTILFYEEETAGGDPAPARLESWDY
jgi:hypothetical protein